MIDDGSQETDQERGILPTLKNPTAPVEQRLRAELTQDDLVLVGPEA
ncbi:hypothetical protein [Kitasatospora sp. NPDC098663]